MTGKSGVYTVILVFSAFVLSGCPSPIGIIGGGLTGLLVEPQRVTYTVGESFQRSALKVFVTYRDKKEAVLVSECEVWIFEDHDNSDESTLVPATGYTLSTLGMKLIMVRYKDLSYQYFIQVQPDDGTQKQADGGITFTWKE